MKEESTTINQLWADLAIEELVRQGVTAFFMASGSRCTPLTLAVARHPKAEAILHFDERACAFQALGWAKAAQRPAAVITTSGTAVANLAPAATEAAQDGVPLLLLTADRPPELRDSGANQAIDQVKCFGSLVRWFFDVPCPTREVEPRFLLTTIAQAVRRAVAPDPGPVHLNFMFRDPLVPEGGGEDLSESRKALADYNGGSSAYTGYEPSSMQVPDASLDELARALAAAKRGILVVGALRNGKEQEAVLRLASQWGWPVLTDVCSGLRSPDRLPLLVQHGEAIVRTASFAKDASPDVVLHLGGRLVSKHVDRFVGKASRSIRISELPHRLDPHHSLSLRIEADLVSTCERLAERLAPTARSDWHNRWLSAGMRASKAVEAFEREATSLSEPIVARRLWQTLPEDHLLFVGNSMPIRDMDAMAYGGGRLANVSANRGASGIDGLCATACGYARAMQRPMTLLLGDLSLLHDLNSLNIVSHSPVPIRIVVLNNHGGGIFHFLPVSGQRDLFEPYFGTPHPYRFEAAAAMFGLAYANPKTIAAFDEQCDLASQRENATLIEIETDREENVALHRSLLDRIVAAVDGPA